VCTTAVYHPQWRFSSSYEVLYRGHARSHPNGFLKALLSEIALCNLRSVAAIRRLALKNWTRLRRQYRVNKNVNTLPPLGFAIEIDGRIKSEFETIDGATAGARELKARFPNLQIRVYDAAANRRIDVLAT
jgi:hypothetical protein